MIRRRSVLVLALLMGAMAASAWHTVASLVRPPTVTARKLDEASRITYYRMTRDNGPRFLLSGAETTLRLITHVRLPPELGYDPLRRIRYGVRLAIRDGDELIWDREIHTQSRQSKALCIRDMDPAVTTEDPCTLATDADKLDFSDIACVGGKWRCENSFVRDERVQLSDDRMLTVHLPRDIPTDAVLELSLIGDVTVGFVRVYDERERSAQARGRAARALGVDRRRQAVWSSTYVPWSMAPVDEREGRLRHRRDRMSAIGEDGADYFTRVVYYTGFRLPLDALTEDEAIPVHRRRYAAFNLVGPAEVSLLVDTLPPGHDVDADAGVRVSWIPALAPVVDEDDVVPAVVRERELGTGVHQLVVPAGLHSLHVRTDSVRPLGVQLLGGRSVAFGAPPNAGGQRGRLRPDDIRIPVAMTGPDQSPIVVVGSGETDPLSRVMRIQVRWLDVVPAEDASAPARDAQAPFSGELVIELEGTGEVLRQQLFAVRAPYEWLDRTGHAWAGTSEPIDIDLIVPERIGRVRLTTTEPAALRLFRYLPNPVIYELPYRAVALRDTRWRYARVERRMWWPMSPFNQDELAAEDRLATLVAQARLEPIAVRASDGGSEPGTPGVARTPGVATTPGVSARPGRRVSVRGAPIAPLDAPERHLVLESVTGEWGAGMLTALPVSRPTRFRFGADAARRAALYYWLEPEELGAEITLAVAGAPPQTLRFTPATTHGYFELPALAPGIHTLTATTTARKLELYVSRPAAEQGVGRYAMRWVYALGRDGLRLRVVKPAGRPVVVNLVLYAPWREAPPEQAVRVVIGGTTPLRTPGLWPSGITHADRRLPIPAATQPFPTRFTDRGSGVAGYPRRLSIRLGDDIQPGTHEIDVYSSYGGRLWARLFVTDAARDARDRAIQWKFRAP